MKSKKISLVAISTAAVLAITGCSSSGDSAEGDLNIAMVSKGFQHQFWQAVQKGAENAAAELGVTITFEGPESESQVDKQLEMLQAAIDRKVDAIGYASLDPQAPLPLLAQAKEGNIPVYMFDAAAGNEADLGSDGPALGIARTDGEAAAALGSIKDAAVKATESLGSISLASDSTNEYHKQVQGLAKNLGSLNTIYELELQESNNHLKALNQFYGKLAQASEAMNGTAEDALKAKEQIGALANNLGKLNQVYGNMLTAMQGR